MQLRCKRRGQDLTYLLRPFMVCALLLLSLISRIARAQEDLRFPVEGYISAVRSPNSFDVNNLHVSYQPRTPFGAIGGGKASPESPIRNQVHVGSFVKVKGHFDKRTKTTTASAIYLFNDWDQKLSGLGVIEKVLQNGSEPLYRADGYQIRIIPATNLTFSEELNSLADIHTNIWIRYEGKRDPEGVLVAARATFLPARPARSKSLFGQSEDLSQGLLPGSARQNPDPAQSPDGKQIKPAINPETFNRVDFEKTLDADGNLTEDAGIRWGVLRGWHTIPANRAIQDRVRRVGQRLIPTYQQDLSDDDPSRIHFRFYAVSVEDHRSEICPLSGLILVPTKVLERLQNDDQLAAVIADGVAYNLQHQAARVNADNRLFLGAYTAMAFAPALLFLPALDAAVTKAGNINLDLQEQRSRVALSLMHDAGYDVTQAPQAWRLLTPKHPPKNPDTLDYPDISGYQLGIIYRQYSHRPTTPETASLR